MTSDSSVENVDPLPLRECPSALPGSSNGVRSMSLAQYNKLTPDCQTKNPTDNAGFFDTREVEY